MPEETIRQRFNVGEEAHVVIEMVGRIIDGMMGTGFLYTNKESLTIGGLHARRLREQPEQDQPYVLLGEMKRHPAIAPLIEGGEMKEYRAHLIPEAASTRCRVVRQRLDDRRRLRRLLQRGAPRGSNRRDDQRFRSRPRR